MVLLYIDDASTLLLFIFLTYIGLGCFTLFMAAILAETIPASQIVTALELVMRIAAAGSLIALLLSLFLMETAPVKTSKA